MVQNKTVLYYDCFSGISGDMNLGAMIDLGVNVDYLNQELQKINLSGWHLHVTKNHKKGIWGTNVKVIISNHHDNHHSHPTEDHHSHNHHNDKHHQGHHHDHHHIKTQTHEHHEHRGYKEIETLISTSQLSETVKKMSLAIFLKIGEAEAKIHNKTLDEIHFHEVGAVDSIIDIIGAAICLDYLKPDIILSSFPELGGGFVKCAHGTFPVPAPAVVEILKGVQVKTGAVPFETTTPTGAAILACTVSSFSEKQSFSITKIGYGIGERDTDIPNVLRVILGEQTKSQQNENNAYILECNIDDMNPELYDYVFEKLFEKGAMDVFVTPIIMKKSRPANKLSVLCAIDKKDMMKEFIFTNTTTFGIREIAVHKTDLVRDFESVETKYGTVRIKNAYLHNTKISSKPEYEDCKKLAMEHGVSIKEIYGSIK